MRRTPHSVKRVAIFDFDGTLGDVVPLMRQIYNDFAKRKGYPELTEEAFQKLRKGTLRDVMKWTGVKPWQVPGLLREGRAVFYKHSKDVQLFDGMAELVEGLHEQGWEMYILSSNSPKTIREILRRNGIAGYMTVLKRPPLFGKATSIKNLVRRKRYNREQVWMIGDEIRDIEAANKAGIKSVAVAWGLQHKSALAEAGPTVGVVKVSQLKEYLMKGE